MQVIYCMFLPINTGIFNGFSADGDEVMNRLPDGSIDESVDVQMEGSFPGYCIVRNFHTAILIGIFTVNLADGRIDRTDDGHTAFQMEFWVESHFGWQTDKSCN